MGFTPKMQGWLSVHKPISVIHHINKMKDKTTDPLHRCRKKKKTPDKIQHSFMIKTLNKLGLDKMYLNTIGHNDKPTANNILYSE